jgi:hypothetical protein
MTPNHMNKTIQLLCIYLICAVVAVSASAQTWSELTPASGPAPTSRTLSGAIYDPVAHAMIMFGGEDGGGRLNDVWSFDLSAHTWTNITPSSGSMPAGRITPALVYDVDHHQMLLFSGLGVSNTFLNDTWAFDLNTHTWTELLPANPLPSIRYGVATCYDKIGKTQVIFAGFTFQGRFDDTWRFDPTGGGTWSNVTPAGTSPLERCLHGAAYDELDRLMIMYGGQNGGALGDLWVFDLSTELWSELTPVSGPDPRWFSTFEYDRVNHRVTMFSGNRNTLGKANDVWVFDLSLNEWVELFPAGTPPTARDGAAAIHVASEDRFYVFGGESTVKLNDIWSLDNLSDTPTGIGGAVPVTDGRIVLHQNYPNPFNPSTVIRFTLPEPSLVAVDVFDVRGRRVRVLVRGHRGSGPHTVSWDGMDDAGDPVGSGVFLYRLQAGVTIQTRKMVLIK